MKKIISVIFVSILALSGCTSKDTVPEGSKEGETKADTKDGESLLNQAVDRFGEYQSFTYEFNSEEFTTYAKFVKQADDLYAYSDESYKGKESVYISKYKNNNEKTYDILQLGYVDESRKQVKYQGDISMAYGHTTWDGNYGKYEINLRMLLGFEYKDFLEYFDISVKVDGDTYIITLVCNDLEALTSSFSFGEVNAVANPIVTYSRNHATFVVSKDFDILNATFDTAYIAGSRKYDGITTVAFTKQNNTSFDTTLFDTIEKSADKWDVLWDIH